MDMKKGGQGLATKHRDSHLEFIRKSVDGGRPPNMIIVLDTHSDTFSGQLQVAGGLTGVGSMLTLPDLVRTYVGDAILGQLANASAIARSYDLTPELSPGVQPWADITPKARGGWCVLVMVSCGSSVRVPTHWEYITQLFSQ